MRWYSWRWRFLTWAPGVAGHVYIANGVAWTRFCKGLPLFIGRPLY